MNIQLKKKPVFIRYLFYIILGIAFLSLSVYVSILAFGPRRLKIDAEDYSIARVEEIPFLEYLDVEGIVHPIQIIQINALESGYVERIVAEEGAMLDVGDTILVLSNISLLRTIEDEEAEWQNQQRNYQEQ